MKPLIGITMGDPAGIGPEIAVRALVGQSVRAVCRPLVVGDAGVMHQAVKRLGLDLQVNPVASPEAGSYKAGTLDVLDQQTVDLDELQYGKVSAMCGNAAFQAVRKVIELALAGELDATVTGPLNKESLNLAGHHFAGHTEIYARFTDTRDYTMMLAEGDLRVVHVSTHVSLREACDRVKKERILEVIRLADDACRRMGILKPRIGVAGLNPHSGEGGMFGREEIEEILPAVEAAKAEGMDADGPVPADTLYSKGMGGLYDICVAMYHDQGHIPVKVTGFRYNREKQAWDSVSGVNITLGLPIIRTSVDHGTAFDQAGKGTATPDSLIHAVEYAVKLTGRGGA